MVQLCHSYLKYDMYRICIQIMMALRCNDNISNDDVLQCFTDGAYEPTDNGGGYNCVLTCQEFISMDQHSKQMLDVTSDEGSYWSIEKFAHANFM
jgi:hypothetical protein